uniref:Uncharacterized protein LOC113798244 isoform X2 n=1 Tax=Dermatophagoides pteronyssinus TaxID=6956 RepID=A0A6P6YGE1_DERPT|nr:uncharacterized protein LOC113798244 isoform X2 [Dermatophagoides pteronyssinus]
MESIFINEENKVKHQTDKQQIELIFLDKSVVVDSNQNRLKRLRKKSKRIAITDDDDTDTGDDSLASTSISTIHLSEFDTDNDDFIDNNNRSSTPKKQFKKIKFDSKLIEQQQREEFSSKKSKRSNIFHSQNISSSRKSSKKTIKLIDNNQIISNKNQNKNILKQQQHRKQKQNLSPIQLQLQQPDAAITDAAALSSSIAEAAATKTHPDNQQQIIVRHGHHLILDDKSDQQQQSISIDKIDESNQNRSSPSSIDCFDDQKFSLLKNKKSKRRRSIDEEIHQRYKHYLQLETDLKDQNKTDYTYAHSYSYSPLVSQRLWYNWTVPNMSRQSIRHNNHQQHRSSPNKIPELLQSDMIKRRFVDNIPISTIQPTATNTQSSLTTRRIISSSTTYQQNVGNETHFVRPRIIEYHQHQNLNDQPLHSTPLKPIQFDSGSSSLSSQQQQSIINKTITTVKGSSNIEFSDDEDDGRLINNEAHVDKDGGDGGTEDLNQTVRHTMTLRSKPIEENNGKMKSLPKQRLLKRSSTNARINDHYLGQYSEDDNGFEDDNEDEDEELTIIRRIHRFFITTVRHIPFVNSVVNDNVQPPLSSISNNHDLNETYISSSSLPSPPTTTNAYNSRFFPQNSSSRWFRRRFSNQNYYQNIDDGDDDRVMQDSSKLGFWSPSFCLRFSLGLFLILFLLPLLISYLLGSGSSYYNMLQWTTNAIDLRSSPSSSLSFFDYFSSFLIWPSFLSLNSLPKWSLFSSSPSSSSSYSPPAGESYLFDRRIFDAEISALRKELLSLKEMNQQQRQLDSASVPTVIDPQLVDRRIHELESQLTTCCSRSNISWDQIRHEIENHLAKNFDTKLSKMQQHYDEELKSQMENIRVNTIRLFDEYRNRVDMNLSSVIDQIRSELIANHQNQLKQRQQQQQQYGSSNLTPITTTADVERLIEKALAKYDADKTGEADFALESSGGWIMKTRCSESYELSWGTYKLFGMTIWRSINSPRVVIQSGVVPGECWCFAGSEGRLGIHLSARIIPTAFSYEHIPSKLSRDGHIKSAPNHLIVYGLRHEMDLDPIQLGEYYYQIPDDNGDDGENSIRPLQRFIVQNTEAAKHTFDMIELNVKSNHGHPDYTCLYRFRVHGIHPSITNE